jgi:hypothetical protein
VITCPHCEQPGIRPLAKFWAGPADPAVCQHCDGASCTSSSIETASTILYVLAGFSAFILIILSFAEFRRGEPVSGPSPGALLISLLLFYVAVEIAKVYWAPMTALSESDVARKKSIANRVSVALILFLVVVWFLDM